MRNAVHLGLSFCFIFLSFSVAQNSQTSADSVAARERGFVGLTILYGVFTLANLVSSFLVSLLGIKNSLMLGAMTYALYVAANVHIISELLYVSSAVIGVGAAVLWTAQGAFISQCATSYEVARGLPLSSTMGMFNGVFFSIFQVNQFIGNLLAASLYKFAVPAWIVFTVMFVICFAGSLSLMCLATDARTPPLIAADRQALANDVEDDEIVADEYDDEHNEAILRRDSPRAAFDVRSILSSVSLLTDVRMISLIAIMIYSGLSQGFIYGVFPPLVTDVSEKFFVLSAFGAFDAVSSMAMGRLSDMTGRMPIVAIGLIAHSAVFAYVMFVNPSNDPSTSWWTYYLLALGLGLGDGVFNTQIYAILGTFFETQADAAFANFKLFQSGSTMAAFLYGSFITDNFMLTAIPQIGLIVGVTALIICDIAVAPVNGRGVPSSLVDGDDDDAAAKSPQRGNANVSSANVNHNALNRKIL